jgi:hypothetical protein
LDAVRQVSYNQKPKEIALLDPRYFFQAKVFGGEVLAAC